MYASAMVQARTPAASRRIRPRTTHCLRDLGASVLAVVIAVAGLSIPIDATAVVRRCVGPDGGTIYTDRPCDQFNARDYKAPPATATSDSSADDTGPVRSDCSRTPDALLFDLRRAVESSNINALAGLYHWPGVGGRAAVSIMDRLEDLAAEPGASVDLIYPEAAFVVHDRAAYPELPAENPIGIRVARVVDAASMRAPEQTLGLRRHAGCWWIHF